MLAVPITFSLLLIILVVRFVIKNMFINFKTSRSKLKNIILILLVLSTFILSVSVEFAAIRVDEKVSYLKNQLAINKSITIIGHDGNAINYAEEIETQIALAKNKATDLSLYTSLGFLFYLWLWMLNRSISNEIKGSSQV